MRNNLQGEVKRQHRRSRIAISYLLALTFLLSACDVPMTDTIPPDFAIKTIQIHTGQNINNKMALSIDFVQIYEKSLVTTLQSMDATSFQQKKEQILLDHPDGIGIWTYEFTDNESFRFKMPLHKNYWAIMIFIHFSSGGTKINVPSHLMDIRLQINDETFKMSEEEEVGSYTQLKTGDFA